MVRTWSKRVTPARFELAPFRNGTLNRRLRPLGQSVNCSKDFFAARIHYHEFCICAKSTSCDCSNIYRKKTWTTLYSKIRRLTLIYCYLHTTDDNVVDGDEDEFNGVANEPHDGETNRATCCDFFKLLSIGLGASLNEPSRACCKLLCFLYVFH